VDESGRPRRRSTNQHPIGTPRGLSANTGPIASAAWLAARELYPKDPKWHAVATLPANGARFQLEIYAEEWGFQFEIADRQSWIRVTDVPFVHGRDDHGLLPRTPSLRQIGRLVRSLESAHGLEFDRAAAKIDTTIADGDGPIRAWIASL
jgi:hypothetical protein